MSFMSFNYDETDTLRDRAALQLEYFEQTQCSELLQVVYQAAVCSWICPP